MHVLEAGLIVVGEEDHLAACEYREGLTAGRGAGTAGTTDGAPDTSCSCGIGAPLTLDDDGRHVWMQWQQLGTVEEVRRDDAYRVPLEALWGVPSELGGNEVAIAVEVLVTMVCGPAVLHCRHRATVATGLPVVVQLAESREQLRLTATSMTMEEGRVVAGLGRDVHRRVLVGMTEAMGEPMTDAS